ncbi:hypothetical protein B0H14DRAFT_2561949 [Mycena olivaceomarginata]|nr:hypothetical protein B0H14DRAFT_2561949 [Mycena olivaceomarginata]
MTTGSPQEKPRPSVELWDREGLGVEGRGQWSSYARNNCGTLREHSCGTARNWLRETASFCGMTARWSAEEQLGDPPGGRIILYEMSTEWDNSAAKFPQCVVGVMGLVFNGTVEGNNNLEDEREASRMEIDLHGAIAPPTRHWLKERYKGAVDEFKVEQAPSVPTAVLNTPRGRTTMYTWLGALVHPFRDMVWAAAVQRPTLREHVYYVVRLARYNAE